MLGLHFVPAVRNARAAVWSLLGNMQRVFELEFLKAGMEVSMEPFAEQQKRPVPWHLWFTGLSAGLFFIWCLDLVPRVLTEGQVVARRQSAGSGAVTASISEGDWSDISASGELSSEAGASDGQARQVADDQWVGLTEPEPEPESEVSDGMESFEDGGVRQAAWEVEQGSDESLDGAESFRLAGDVVSGGALPAEFAAGLRLARALRQQDQILESHAELSALYWKHADQRPLLIEDLRRSARVIFLSAERQFGDPHVVAWGETLESIGREYELPWQYLARLNGIEPEKLQAGQSLKVVRGPFGAVVDLSAFTLTVHMHGWYVQHYRIGIGQDGRTPTGRFSVQEKLENPTWYNPDGGVVEADDPENPLGEYWLGLGDHIGIHGTIDAASIGRAASRGCLHLADEDIQEVYGLLSSGSEVVIRR